MEDTNDNAASEKLNLSFHGGTKENRSSYEKRLLFIAKPEGLRIGSQDILSQDQLKKTR